MRGCRPPPRARWRTLATRARSRRSRRWSEVGMCGYGSSGSRDSHAPECAAEGRACPGRWCTVCSSGSWSEYPRVSRARAGARGQHGARGPAAGGELPRIRRDGTRTRHRRACMLVRPPAVGRSVRAAQVSRPRGGSAGIGVPWKRAATRGVPIGDSDVRDDEEGFRRGRPRSGRCPRLSRPRGHQGTRGCAPAPCARPVMHRVAIRADSPARGRDHPLVCAELVALAASVHATVATERPAPALKEAAC